MKLAAARELIQRNHDGARNTNDLLNRLPPEEDDQ